MANELIGIALGSAVLVKVLDIAYDVYKTKTKKKVDTETLSRDVKRLQENVANSGSASKAILKDRLLFLGRKHLERGEISMRDFESMTDMFMAYRALGGNGFIKEIYEEICELKKI